MTVTDEELMAFADGELSGDDAARVEAAIAADPALAKRIEAERRLKTVLRGHLDPVAEEPVPAGWTAMIAAAGEEDEAGEPPKIISLDAVRARKAEKAAREASDAALARSLTQRWGTGIAIAASLVLGLFVGTQVTVKAPIMERNGTLIASGLLAKGLDKQLASAGDGGPVRILTSFRRQGGDYCRVFASGGVSGIACKEQPGWVLERTINSGKAQKSEYRQASSAETELMTAAQDMALGGPLDTAQEKAAKAGGWR
ncbi:MAG TPA: hypothetical protein VJQ77_03345 [Novosphingobium sp.]|nr:hypothetical protein [Novosphingobium sp.]